jgi:hypothetical protein
MKRLLSLTIILASCSISLCGQDWSPYPAGRTSIYFTDTADLSYRLAYDSVYSAPGLTEFFQEATIEMYNFSTANSPCLGTGDGNMLVGSRVSVSDSMVTLHFERFNIPLPLLTDSLPFILNNDTLMVIQASKRDTILGGVLDSVITFEILGKPNPPNHRRQYGELLLAKDKGLLMHGLRLLWPVAYDYFRIPKHRNLTRSQTPSLDLSGIFDFDVGDLFQYGTRYYTDAYPTSYVIDEHLIISKTVTPDSFKYDIRKFYWRQSGGIDSIDFKRQYPRVFPIMDSNSYSIDSNHMYRVWMRDWEGCGRPGIAAIRNEVLNHDSCVSHALLDETLWFYQYAEGLGETYLAIQDKSSGTVYVNFKKLIYYRKGTENWGTRQKLSSPSPVFKSLKVYPCPAKSILNFQSEETQNYQILDINGGLVESGNTHRGLNKLDVSYLPEGLFFIRLGDGSTARFIKI